MPPEVNNMLYIGLSAFTTNSAAFVYNKAGALSLYITDDMVSFILQLPSWISFHDATLTYNLSLTIAP